MDTWTVIRFIHIVALAFFVGGQVMLAAAVVPALRRHSSDEAMMGVARRFGIGSGIALAALIATGVAMAQHYSRWSDSTLQLKLMLLVLVAVLLGLHIATPKSRAVSVAVLVTSLLIVWLGVDLSHGF